MTFSTCAFSFVFAVLTSTYSAANNIATIGNKKISNKEFTKRFKAALNADPSNPSKRKVLENMVFFELAVQEAKKKKIDQQDSIKEQLNILLYQEIVKKEIQPQIDNIKISEREVRQFYSANPLIDTQHIFLNLPTDATKSEKKQIDARAQKVLQQLQSKKKSFEDLVKKYSEGPSAKTRGNIGWGGLNKLVPEYYQAALKIKKIGQTSKLVRTKYGIHFIKLNGIKPYSKIDHLYKNFIVRRLKEEQGKNLYTQYFNNLKKKYKIKVNYKELDKLKLRP